MKALHEQLALMKESLESFSIVLYKSQLSPTVRKGILYCTTAYIPGGLPTVDLVYSISTLYTIYQVVYIYQPILERIQ